MAIKTVNKVKLNRNEGLAAPFVSATSTTDGYALEASGADYGCLYEFYNSGSGAGTVTIKVGNGLQGVGEDISISLAAGGYAALVVDSGAYKNVSGTNAGYVVAIPSATTVQAKVVQLP